MVLKTGKGNMCNVAVRFVFVVLISITISSKASKGKITNTDILTIIKEIKHDIEKVRGDIKHVRKDIKEELKSEHLQRIQHTLRITRNTTIATLPLVRKEYTVEFEVYPTEFKSEWHNVLHFTTGGNAEASGDRIPGIWFHNSGKGSLLICSAVNGNSNYCYLAPFAFPTKQWTKINIWQDKMGEMYFYHIEINGKGVVNVTNSKPQEFENVKVFVSDAWYEAQPGYIRNLRVMQEVEIQEDDENLYFLVV